MAIRTKTICADPIYADPSGYIRLFAGAPFGYYSPTFIFGAGAIASSVAFGTPIVAIVPHPGTDWATWESQNRCKMVGLKYPPAGIKTSPAGTKCPPAGTKCPPAGIKPKKGG